MSGGGLARIGVAMLLCWTALSVGTASGAPDEADDYVLHCSGCHDADADGVPGVIPSLHGLAPLAQSEVGRAYLVGVPGVAQAPLGDERLARLLNWLLLTYSEPNAMSFSPFDAEEVARRRAEPLRDAPAVRSQLPRELLQRLK
jgi:mono/diheme cytochrome c family protein